MSDEEITHAEKAAIYQLTLKLRPWATGMQRPEVFAEEFVMAMRRAGWKPPLKPPPVLTVNRDVEAARQAAARGAELARKLYPRKEQQ